MKPMIAAMTLMLVQTCLAQDFKWVRDDRVLNPSGIELQTNVTQFQVLDWNGDGSLDFMINETGDLIYYEQVAGDSPFWNKRDLTLPQVGLHDDYFLWGSPKNFRFIDWDNDGDFDLAADSSKFWWNTGSNLSPSWMPDTTILKGIELGQDFFFIDYDADGDWDATAGDFHYSSYVYLNEGTNLLPLWTRLDPELPGESAILLHLNSDNLFDLISVHNVPITPGVGYGLTLYENKGTLLSPAWGETENRYDIWFEYLGVNLPAYDIVDFDGDQQADIVRTDWDRHIVAQFGSGSADSAYFDYDTSFLAGAINVQSHARPVFFDVNRDAQVDLMVTENYFTDFGFPIYRNGQIRLFENADQHFDANRELTNPFPRPLNRPFPNPRRSFTLHFVDFDRDGALDYLLSYFTVDYITDQITGSQIEYFKNVGSNEQPNWVADTTSIPELDAPGSLFYDPHLIDINRDNVFDLLIQSEGKYRFLTLSIIPEMPHQNWNEAPEWFTGIASPNHHSAAFADLTADGLLDLIFGETDGTLQLYKNIGRANMPAWQLVADAFAGIDVDSLAVPAFADLDGDSKLDLAIGNADGRLFYFRNETIVAVEQNPEEMPRQFTLHQNYPNPFNPETTIEYDLPQAGQVRLTIYNLLGQRVRTLVNNWQPAGPHHVSWAGTGESGVKSVSGVYIYELKSGDTLLRKKMVLLH